MRPRVHTSPILDRVEEDAASNGIKRARLLTPRGVIGAQLFEAPAATGAAILVGGVGGGFDSPAQNLYERLAPDLQSQGLSAVRVQFRDPTDLLEATFDILAAAEHLDRRGVSRLGFVGHSFGGAAVIRAAAAFPRARTVVALSTQGYGVEPISRLARDCSVLLIHGREDNVLPYYCSEYAFHLAKEPKRLVLLPKARHLLDEAAPEVGAMVREWLLTELAAPSV